MYATAQVTHKTTMLMKNTRHTQNYTLDRYIHIKIKSAKFMCSDRK